MNFMQYTVETKYDFSLLLEKYMFYGAIILIQIGWTHLYGDIEKDFNRIIIITFTLFALMDMRGIMNLIKFIDSAIYIMMSYFH